MSRCLARFHRLPHGTGEREEEQPSQVFGQGGAACGQVPPDTEPGGRGSAEVRLNLIDYDGVMASAGWAGADA